MSNFIRPILPDIHAVLRKYEGLIVHFSGTPKGAGSNFDFLFPDDLKEVLSGQSQTGLSCSVVMPNDEFGDLACANATGCIGIVLRMRSEQSLLDAHPGDCGSFMKDGVRQTPKARDMSAADVEQTITDRANCTYNEWVVADYSVVGLFAAAPFRISANVPIHYPEEMPTWLRSETETLGFKHLAIEDLVTEFGPLPVYSFSGGQIVEWVSGNWCPIQHHQLYP